MGTKNSTNKKTKMNSLLKDPNTITRIDSLLTFNQLTSKQTDPEYRRKYLQRIISIYSIDELVKKWSSSHENICKFFTNNKVSVFDKNANMLERELDALVNSDNVSNKEIRKRLIELSSKYTSESIYNKYGVNPRSLIYYCSLFNYNLDVSNISNLVEIPENFSLILPEDNIVVEKMEEKKMKPTKVEMVTTVDNHYNIIKTNFVNNSDYNRDSMIIQERQLDHNAKEHISFIEFLKLPYKDREDKLFRLTKNSNLKTDEIEKIIGCPSYNYLKKLYSRHMLFTFYNKEKLKTAFSKLSSFEECQALVLDIIKNKRFSEFNLSEKTFLKFAEDYFDITYSKVNGWMFDDWDAFYTKAVKQAIICYKKNSRITNITEKEVLEFERGSRKIIGSRNLGKIIRAVIMDLHKENHSWISIYDFKTEIEKAGFDLDSNDRIIEYIDGLITKNAFKNEFFTLKKMIMENPVLSDDSNIRWEFVSTKPIVEEIKPPIKKIDKPVAEIKPDISDDIGEEEKHSTIPVITPISEKSTKKSFLNENNFTLTFDEENLDDVMEFIKNSFKLFGNGNVTIAITRNN